MTRQCRSFASDCRYISRSGIIATSFEAKSCIHWRLPVANTRVKQRIEEIENQSCGGNGDDRHGDRAIEQVVVSTTRRAAHQQPKTRVRKQYLGEQRPTEDGANRE